VKFAIFDRIVITMKNLFPSWIVALGVMLVLSACTSRTERTLSGVETLLDSLESRFAPDKRVELWNLSVSHADGTILLEGELASSEAYHAVATSMSERFPGVTNLVKLLPEEWSGRLVNGLVNNSVAHLRRDPSSKSELVSQALLGTPVRILKETDGKVLIQLPDGYLGWVNRSEVQRMEPEALEKYRNMQKIVFRSQYGFVYTEPREGSMPVADLVTGCMLPVIAEKEAYHEVEYPDGRRGWVKKSESVPAGNVFYNDPSGEGVIATAREFHGIPYLWGGASSKNLDCSGLIANVFFMNGIQMPRDADQQSHCGREITTEFNPAGLEEGDLLFFGRKATSEEKESVTHVAIYMEGGEFIHASGYRDRVSINSMDSTQVHFIDTYPEMFVRATRIIGEASNGFRPVMENAYYREIIE
jgi:SH3-like domain-containing protein